MDATWLRRTAATVVLLLLFGAWVWSGVDDLEQVECELCIEFEGRRACSTGLGRDRQDAVRVAQSTACATIPGGVTSAFACDRALPVSLECSQP